MVTNARGHDEQFFASRGFGLRLGFGTAPAVLAVDFMNAFTDEAMPLGANLDEEISAANAVLGSARAAGVPKDHHPRQLWRLRH